MSLIQSSFFYGILFVLSILKCLFLFVIYSKIQLFYFLFFMIIMILFHSNLLIFNLFLFLLNFIVFLLMCLHLELINLDLTIVQLNGVAGIFLWEELNFEKNSIAHHPLFNSCFRFPIIIVSFKAFYL